MEQGHQDLQSHSASLQSDLSSSQNERERLAGEVQDRFEELAKLTRRLVQLEDDLLAARNELRTVTASSSWRLTEPLRRLRGGAEKRPGARNWQRDYRLIKESGLFDRDYYLRVNPDVAKLRIDPIRHYLMHGAAEGRNPSADFNTRDYIRSHPELLTDSSGLNPLIHLISARGANGQG